MPRDRIKAWVRTPALCRHPWWKAWLDARGSTTYSFGMTILAGATGPDFVVLAADSLRSSNQRPGRRVTVRKVGAHPTKPLVIGQGGISLRPPQRNPLDFLSRLGLSEELSANAVAEELLGFVGEAMQREAAAYDARGKESFLSLAYIGFVGSSGAELHTLNLVSGELTGPHPGSAALPPGSLDRLFGNGWLQEQRSDVVTLANHVRGRVREAVALHIQECGVRAVCGEPVHVVVADRAGARSID